jgi:hypothetical protein
MYTVIMEESTGLLPRPKLAFLYGVGVSADVVVGGELSQIIFIDSMSLVIPRFESFGIHPSYSNLSR